MADSVSQPFALTPGDGQAIWYRGSLMTVKLGAEQTGGAFTLIEHAMPAGFAAPPHLHRHDDEPWYVLDGEVTFQCGDLAFRATPGAFIYLPKGIRHQFRVEGDQPARMLLMSYPGGIEHYFAELGEPARARELPPPPTSPPDWARLRAAADRYGIDLQPPE